MPDGTPLLRADATDDELYEPETTLTGTELVKRQVPVIIQGVFHGMRDADEED